MPTQTDLPRDLIDLLAEFDAAGVEYLIVGGQALALHGRPRFTKDADLWLHDTEANIKAATDALVRFGAPPATIEGLREAQGLDVVWMGQPPLRIDLMKSVPGGDFADAWAQRWSISIAETKVQVVDRQTLIALKQTSGRPQDLVDADLLRSDAERTDDPDDSSSNS